MTYTGAFSFGFSNGFLIYGVNNMATVDTLTRNTLNELTANTTASGVVYNISGILQDDKFGIIAMPSGSSAAATFTVYSGDYQNAGVGNYTAQVDGVYTAIALDGARFRKEDGTVDVAFNTPTGFFYSFTI